MSFIKKIIQLFNFKKRLEIRKAKKYYRVLKQGGAFIRFIENDIRNMSKNQVNRHMRRRFDKALHEQGKLSSEMIMYYYDKINKILEYMKTQ